MLRKLLKYDFRSNLKIFLFIWPGIILFSLTPAIFRFLPETSSAVNGLEIALTAAYYLGLAGACILAVVISISRFYKGLLREEGYLMFTLPVTTGRLILSKFLVALVTVSVTCLLSIGGMWLVILNLDRTNLLAYALDQLSNLRAEDWLTLALCVLAVFSGFGMKLAQVYLACAIGHQAKKHCVLLAVVCYYGISVALETVGVMLISLFDSIGAFIVFDMSMNQFLLLAVLLGAALSAVWLALTRVLLNRHLNLE